ncbi:MAG: MMPL family transporter, partial [Leptospirales bacterium]
VREIAMNEPLLMNSLITDRADVTGVIIETTVPNLDPNEIPDVAAYVRKMARDFERDFPGHKTYLSGDVFMATSFAEAGQNDMAVLTPLMYLLILVVLAILLRSFTGVAATLLVVLFSVLAAMGFAGWVGIPLTAPSALAPTIVLTMAIADSVHFLLTMLAKMRAGVAKDDAIIESMRVNFQPIFLTSLTTAIGFLSLNFSDSPPYNDLGNIAAAGVIVAWALAVCLLPVLMSLFPVQVRIRENAEQDGALERFFANSARILTRHSRLIAGGMILVAVLLFLAIPRVRINDQFVHFFDHSFQFRNDTDYMMENLAGMYRIEFSIPSRGTRGVTDPEYLKKLESFSRYLREDSRVLYVSTFSDIMKRVNRTMHGDQSAYYRIPDNRDRAAQYLLLYELSLPMGLDLNNMIDIDKSSTRLYATVNLTSGEALRLARDSESWMRENFPDYMQSIASGGMIMFSHITERNIEGMLRGTILAFLLITITMILALRSVKYGLISLIPNLIPAGMAFGVWSLAVGEIGFSVSVVGAATLGVIVDDTVHFLSKYVQHRRSTGASAAEGVQYAFRNVGPALLITSIVLAIGFGVMSLSPFKLNMTLGVLSALTIVFALVVDLLLLPALLLFFDRSKAGES